MNLFDQIKQQKNYFIKMLNQNYKASFCNLMNSFNKR